MIKLLASLLALLIVLALDFGLFAALIYVICFCFSIAFTWKLAFGIWLIAVLIKLIFCAKNN